MTVLAALHGRHQTHTQATGKLSVAEFHVDNRMNDCNLRKTTDENENEEGSSLRLGLEKQQAAKLCNLRNGGCCAS